MPINKSEFAKALWPGVNAWYGKAYNEWETKYTDLFDSYTDSRAYVEDVGIVSFGLAAAKPAGESVSYDTENQGFTTRYTHTTYGLGFIITDEMIEDDQYSIVGERRAKGLAFSMRQTKEIVGANVYNRAFNSSYTGGDGVEMCSAAHPNVSGGTWANELTTAADLSQASLEQACIDVMKFTNDRGLKIHVLPQSLIVPPELLFEAERILMSPLEAGNSNNDINVMKGKFPKGIKMNPYLTDADAWFIRTNAPEGMKYFERRADQFTEDNDFDTDNLKYKATARYSFGWTDPRGVFGSPGA